MGIRRHNIVPFSRDYRRAPRIDMGLPKGKPPRQRRGILEWVIGGGIVAALALVLVPALLDVANGWIKPHEGCRVLTVIDGDTVKLLCPAGGFQSGRLLGFDTPELKARCASELGKAIAATHYLRWRLWTGGRITAVTEGTDRYGRRLTRLLIDGENVARPMIASGLARPYDGGLRGSWCN
jgi:endonuclease YncB( thermonuclease family)